MNGLVGLGVVPKPVDDVDDDDNDDSPPIETSPVDTEAEGENVNEGFINGGWCVPAYSVCA